MEGSPPAGQLTFAVDSDRYQVVDPLELDRRLGAVVRCRGGRSPPGGKLFVTTVTPIWYGGKLQTSGAVV